jgi:hypothetical protein
VYQHLRDFLFVFVTTKDTQCNPSRKDLFLIISSSKQTDRGPPTKPSTMSNVHAQAINLARRYSERNEHDLLRKFYRPEPCCFQKDTPIDVYCVSSCSIEENFCEGRCPEIILKTRCRLIPHTFLSLYSIQTVPAVPFPKCRRTTALGSSTAVA